MREELSYITIIDENERVVWMGGGEEGNTHLVRGGSLKDPHDCEMMGLDERDGI